MTDQLNLNHFDEQGNAVMVNVEDKSVTRRSATACGQIHVCREIIDAVVNHTAAKGDVLGVARIAGIMGAKQTSSLIPLCHPLALTNCAVDFTVDPCSQTISVTATVKTDGKTGVEMEALTAASISLLTIYDMCKAIDKGMEITGLRLLEKSGGKSGIYRASPGTSCNSTPDAGSGSGSGTAPSSSPAFFAISGVKNSGKTTLITRLLPVLLKHGVQTAVIKHDGHDFVPDVPDTDSFRIRQAGACGTAVFSDNRFLITAKQQSSERLIGNCFSGVQLILLEGFKHSPYPKVELIRLANSQSSICNPATLLGCVTDLPQEKYEALFEDQMMPRFSFDDIEALATLILDTVKAGDPL